MGWCQTTQPPFRPVDDMIGSAKRKRSKRVDNVSSIRDLFERRIKIHSQHLTIVSAAEVVKFREVHIGSIP